MFEYGGDRVAQTEFVNPVLLEAIRAHSTSSLDPRIKADMVSQFAREHSPRRNVGLVIGRFQPPHDGHAYLFEMALAVAERVIIAIGSANKKDSDNPFSVDQRRRMVLDKLLRHQLPLDRVSFVSIKDYEDETEWFTKTLERTGEVDMVLGNNDGVNRIFRGARVMALEVPLFDRETQRGTDIREKLRKEGLLPRFSNSPWVASL